MNFIKCNIGEYEEKFFNPQTIVSFIYQEKLSQTLNINFVSGAHMMFSGHEGERIYKLLVGEPTNETNE